MPFFWSACANLGKKRGEVIGAEKQRERVRAREAICYVARRRTELSVKLLAESLGADARCVSRSASRMERLVAEDEEMKKMVNAVASVLTNRKYYA
jgi:chromosomal replication initiation ATPase DnaA